MNLRLVRDVFGKTWTLGILSVDGRSFGFVCEDKDRELDAADPKSLAAKVRGETAIPVGRYRVLKTWSPRYQRDVMELQGVPGYAGVRIHVGNDDGDTRGCLLPGLRRSVTSGTVGKSGPATAWLDAEFDRRTAAGEEVWIDVVRDSAAWASRPR